MHYVKLINRYNIIRLFLLCLNMVYLTACGGSGGSSTSSDQGNTQQSVWQVINQEPLSDYFDRLIGNENFESNFVFGLRLSSNHLGLITISGITDPFYRINGDGPILILDQMSCYKTTCFGYKNNKLGEFAQHIYMFQRDNNSYSGTWVVLESAPLSDFFNGVETISESTFYITTYTEIFACHVNDIHSSNHTATCEEITNGYGGSPITGIYVNNSNTHIYLETLSGIWSYESSSWVFMESSPQNINNITIDGNGHLFAASSFGGYYYDGTSWQQILNTPQSSVVVCDIGNYADDNEVVYFSGDYDDSYKDNNTQISIFHPFSNVVESIAANVVDPETNTIFNNGIRHLVVSNNCYIYGMTRSASRADYVVTLKNSH